MDNFKVIDSHTHFLVRGTNVANIKKKYVAKHGIEKWKRLQPQNSYIQERWSKAYTFPKPDPIEHTIEETAEKWLKEVEENNLERIIFTTAGGTDCSNKNMKKIVSIAPDKFVGYAYIDIFDESAPEELERSITEYGLKGLKILAPDLDEKLDSEKLYPLWQVAEKYKIPVLIHFGILGAAGGISHHINISPIILHDVARAFPEVPFIIPHFGCAHVKALLQLAWVCPNIYVDTSGSNQWTNWMPYPLTIKDLFKKFYETIGSKRIIFGTDSSWFPRGFVSKYLEFQMKDCVELGMSNNDIHSIFNGNIKKLLKI